MVGFHHHMNDIHDARALHRVDMNLFAAFDALLRERSVTRAAQRVGVTQSAMSHTLRRLRELFGDPLLVRGRSGMVLTPRAEALVGPLRSGLASLRHALEQPLPFEPAHARRSFRLVSPDLFDSLALPPLLGRLRDEAPGVNVSVVPRPRDLGAALESGEVDLAVVPVWLDDSAEPMDGAAALRRRSLFRDRLCCYLRAGHPALDRRGRLSLAKYAALAHVLVSPQGEGPGVVDVCLAERGRERRVALRVPHFSSALAVVVESDLVLTAPSSLARLAGNASRLVSTRAPLALPEHAVTMVWHARFGDDLAHRWLRSLLVDVSAPLAPR
jgi:DNA-binding transcriptional LysR family regulator